MHQETLTFTNINT